MLRFVHSLPNKGTTRGPIGGTDCKEWVRATKPTFHIGHALPFYDQSQNGALFDTMRWGAGAVLTAYPSFCNYQLSVVSSIIKGSKVDCGIICSFEQLINGGIEVPHFVVFVSLLPIKDRYSDLFVIVTTTEEVQGDLSRLPFGVKVIFQEL